MNINQGFIGESIEVMMERLLSNEGSLKEDDKKEKLYTKPEEGIQYGLDIRGDRFDEMIDRTNKVTDSIRDKREEKYTKRKEALEELKKPKGDGTAESIDGTSEGSTSA